MRLTFRQLIITGDFFQLPPVSKSIVKFAFEAEQWSKVIPRTFNLTQVFRQKDQGYSPAASREKFQACSHILIPSRLCRYAERDALRKAQLQVDRKIQILVQAYSLRRWHRRNRTVRTFGIMKYQKMRNNMLLCRFPRREDVDRSNSTRMRALQTEERMYAARDSGMDDPVQRERLLSNFMAPQTLILRLHAQVMLIKNTDEMLVNGSLGTVIAFSTPEAWASLAETHTVPKDAEKKPIPKAGQEFPVVEFMIPNGGKRQMLVVPEQWKIELPNGEVQASRSQVIISLASTIDSSNDPSTVSCLLFYRGLCLYTNHRVRPWSASRSIWVKSSRKVGCTTVWYASTE